MNEINHTSLKNLYYLLGVIDGVLQAVQQDKKQTKDTPFLSKALEKQEQEWQGYRQVIVNKLQGKKCHLSRKNMKRKTKKKQEEWRGVWMKVTITISCPKHSDLKRTVLFSDYTEALENKDRKKKWFCHLCGKRLMRNYGDVSFILPDDFNTKSKKGSSEDS